MTREQKRETYRDGRLRSHPELEYDIHELLWHINTVISGDSIPPFPYLTEAEYVFKFNERLRAIITSIGQSKGRFRQYYTAALIGCDEDHFREYFQSHFTRKMSWDNWGKWHIDHIAPLSWSQSVDESIRLSRYSNLRPLWAIDNIRKHNNAVTAQLSFL